MNDLDAVVDLQSIKESNVPIGVDPLGGASVGYWDAIGDRYGLNLNVVNRTVDPTFRFMTVDWDGQIRMDPSSPYAMARIVGLKDRFDVAFASDTDADRHGIVSHSHGLLDPNHYLSVAISYLFANRPRWSQTVAVGKTVVSSSIIDRVAASLNRRLLEVPVGFKWFVDGLIDRRCRSPRRPSVLRPCRLGPADSGAPGQSISSAGVAPERNNAWTLIGQTLARRIER